MLRKEVKAWRDRGYEDATDDEQEPVALVVLRATFDAGRLRRLADARVPYFFAQREALETIIYLMERTPFKDKFGLMRFDSVPVKSKASLFDETGAAWS